MATGICLNQKYEATKAGILRNFLLKLVFRLRRAEIWLPAPVNEIVEANSWLQSGTSKWDTLRCFMRHKNALFIC